jgi:hypothetical protein
MGRSRRRVASRDVRAMRAANAGVAQIRPHVEEFEFAAALDVGIQTRTGIGEARYSLVALWNSDSPPSIGLIDEAAKVLFARLDQPPGKRVRGPRCAGGRLPSPWRG